MSHDLIQMRLMFRLEQEVELCCDLDVGDSPFVTQQVKKLLFQLEQEADFPLVTQQGNKRLGVIG